MLQEALVSVFPEPRIPNIFLCEKVVPFDLNRMLPRKRMAPSFFWKRLSYPAIWAEKWRGVNDLK